MSKLRVVLALLLAGGLAQAGLVTHLEFEGDIVDTTGNISYGTGTSGEGAYVAGPTGFGQGMWFDKASANVVFAQGVGAQMSTVTDAVTIAFWQYGSANLPSKGDPTILFSANDPVNWSRISVQLPYNAANEYLFFDSWGPTSTFDRGYKWLGGDQNQYKGQWNHWAIVKDTTADNLSAATARIKIYLNGVLWMNTFDSPFAAGNGDGTQSLAGIENIYIGAEKQWWYFYDGGIDDFRIYDEVLSDAAIGDLVPEPMTLMLLGLGSLGLRRRK